MCFIRAPPAKQDVIIKMVGFGEKYLCFKGFELGSYRFVSQSRKCENDKYYMHLSIRVSKERLVCKPKLGAFMSIV